MSKQLFIINDATASDLKVYKAGDAIAAIAEVAEDVTNGIEAVAGQTVLEQLAGDEIAFFASGKTSVDVDAGECVRLEKLAYSAGTQQVWTVDASDAGGSTGVEEGCIKVIVTTPGTANLPMYTFCSAAAADFVATKDEFAMAESGGTVTITANINQHIRIACSGSLEGVVATKTSDFLPTTGTAADVAALEEDFLPYDGVTNKVGFPVIKPNSKVTAAATYDIVVADFVTVSAAKSGMNAMKGEKIKMMFACKIDGNDASGADAIMTALANLK
jgi:hypothetical protein